MKKNNFEVYKHYKGGLCLKLLEAIDSETGEDVIVFFSLTDGKTYIRNKKTFHENVNKDNFYGPRFFKQDFFGFE
jgi:hypothetical protein